MYNGSSDTYTVKITLLTEEGDLPDIRGVQDLIATQMSGELDDPACNGGTGLFCGGVTVIGSDTDWPEGDSFTVISDMAEEARSYIDAGAHGRAWDLLNSIVNYIDAECV